MVEETVSKAQLVPENGTNKLPGAIAGLTNILWVVGGPATLCGRSSLCSLSQSSVCSRTSDKL